MKQLNKSIDSIDETYDPQRFYIKHRTIFLIGQINEQNANYVIQQLIYLSKENNDPIHLYIQSPGGCINSAFAIYDVMNIIKNRDNIKIITYAMGLVASAATIIFVSGSKGDRYFFENSEFLIHSLRMYNSEGYEKYMDIQNKAENIEICNQKILKIYKKNTYNNINDSTLKHFLSREQILSSDSAKVYGFTDHIIGENHNVNTDDSTNFRDDNDKKI